jgi:hypothetical protein
MDHDAFSGLCVMTDAKTLLRVNDIGADFTTKIDPISPTATTLSACDDVQHLFQPRLPPLEIAIGLAIGEI